MTRILRRLAALAAAIALAFALGACQPEGSPNCPPGQWWVDKPGYGWVCESGSGLVFTPAAFAPSPGGAR